ncbi:MAG: LysR family transcriptional regulator [Chloroflexota bacterium]
MTLEQLRMLTKIAEEGSLFAAAEALHKTQPTVSVAMKKLEKELGLQLISREQYRAALTTEGKVLYEKAKTILQQVDTFQGLAGHLAVGNEAELRIAIEASCSLPLMIQIMGICNERFPETQFRFSVECIMGALERLRVGEADLAINPFAETENTFESFPLTSTEMIRVASPKLPLCAAQIAVPFEALRGYVQVIVKDSSRNPSNTFSTILEGGRHWYVNDHFTKKELILAGMGWGRLHYHFIKDELQEGTLMPLEVANHPLSMHVDISVARKTNQAHGPIASALWSILRELVQELAQE